MNVGPGRGTEYYLPGPGAAAGLLDTQEIFDTESQMLQDIAAKESCVMTGRSGSTAACSPRSPTIR